MHIHAREPVPGPGPSPPAQYQYQYPARACAPPPKITKAQVAREARRPKETLMRYIYIYIYRWDHTLCDKEFEGKGAVVRREEKLFNQPICQPISCWDRLLRSVVRVDHLLKSIVKLICRVHLLRSAVECICLDQLLSCDLLRLSVELCYWDHLLTSTVDIIC